MRKHFIAIPGLWLGLAGAALAADAPRPAGGTAPAVSPSAGVVEWGPAVDVSGGVWGRMVELHHDAWLCVTTQFRRGTNSLLQLSLGTNGC